MIALYPEPHYSDLEGWKRHLEWLRTEPEEIPSRDEEIELAEYHIMLLETPDPFPPQRPTEAD